MDAVSEKFKDTITPDSRSDSRASDRTLLNMSDTELEERSRGKDLEMEGAESKMPLAPVIVTKDHVAPDPLARAKMLMWMAINTLATVFIVSSP